VFSSSRATTFRTLDGLHLAGTIATPGYPPAAAVLLVHGGGVTREEGGFFTRLADGLADFGLASLRFDLRGHGESEGAQEELTLSTVLNDIRVALAHLRETTETARVSLLGTSFGGGICGYYAAKRPAELIRLVLLNPQLDYKKRTIDNPDYWTNDTISDDKALELDKTGAIQFKPNLKHGRPFLNEVFWLQPDEAVGEIRTPTLVVHGTADTLVPIDGTREAITRFTAPVELVEVDGAQHGFAVDDDPQYLDPQSRRWQTFVIQAVSQWLATGSTKG
jgi:alpha-beta hydrolase superfamily lysophospholipase